MLEPVRHPVLGLRCDGILSARTVLNCGLSEQANEHPMGERQLGRPLPGPGALGLLCCTGTPEDPGASGASQRVPLLGGGGSWLSDPNTLDWPPKHVHLTQTSDRRKTSKNPGGADARHGDAEHRAADAAGICGLPDLWN